MVFSMRLPGWVAARGSGHSYERLDDSAAPRDLRNWEYRVVELTMDGPGDATPWFPVRTIQVGTRERTRGR